MVQSAAEAGAPARFRFTPSRIDFRIRAIAVIGIVAVMSWMLRHFHLDDSYIYARYVRNVFAGRGLVFNADEPVNALTSIFYTWIVLGAGTLFMAISLPSRTPSPFSSSSPPFCLQNAQRLWQASSSLPARCSTPAKAWRPRSSCSS